MASFLFWNLFGRQETNRAVRAARILAGLTRVAAARHLDVLMFAECTLDPVDVTRALNAAGVGTYHLPPSRSERIRIFTRLHEGSFIDAFNNPVGGRLTIRRVQVGPPPGILLAVLHLQDRMSWSRDAQSMEAVNLAQDIARTEDEVGHRRTVLVGDLNMNPFEPGVVGAQALNAVMAKNLVRPVERIVAGRGYRCFYNPMWGCFGDRSDGPPGTFFLSGSDPASHFWNVYDQVLLRPDLMHSLTDLEILDSDGSEPLVNRSRRPARSNCSDHLPLFFRLDMEREINGHHHPGPVAG